MFKRFAAISLITLMPGLGMSSTITSGGAMNPGDLDLVRDPITLYSDLGNKMAGRAERDGNDIILT